MRKALEDGVTAGQRQMQATTRGKDVSGWEITLDMGRSGTNYPYRAAWTFYGLGGNRAEDAVYLFASKDGDGAALNAATKYILNFSNGEIPPVNAFWSLTMYDADSHLVPNAINRYALGDRSGMKFGDDGSLTTYI